MEGDRLILLRFHQTGLVHRRYRVDGRDLLRVSVTRIFAMVVLELAHVVHIVDTFIRKLEVKSRSFDDIPSDGFHLGPSDAIVKKMKEIDMDEPGGSVRTTSTKDPREEVLEGAMARKE
jgi:hypothetical protein